MEIDPKKQQWFAIRSDFKREQKLKQHLEDKGLQCFIPMHEVVRRRNGKVKTLREPVVYNLLFVRADYQTLKAEKQAQEGTDLPLYWRMERASAEKRPATIPDKVMDDFIAVCTNKYSEFVDISKMDKLTKGDYVEITDGIFRGVRGYYSRPIKQKCVAVIIEGLTAVCTSHIPRAFIRVIETREEREKRERGGKKGEEETGE